MNDKISNLLNEAEILFNHTLNLKDDLQKLLLISSKFKIENKFEELAFTGKYVYGLMKVIKSGVNLPEVESLDHVKKDLSANMELLMDQIRQIISGADENTRSYFENKYLLLNQQSILQLNLLIEDLDLVKKYINYRKRNN